MQANEETPPALAPLFKVADVLEAELPKQDENERTAYAQNAALATTKAADQTNGNPYAEYLGKGGTIYVHVFDVEDNTTYTDIEDSKGNLVKPTRAHYIRAAEICNLKFKEIDVDLKVEIHFAQTKNGQKPLNLKQFQQRKNYSPTDSYVLIGQKDMLERSEVEKRKKYLPSETLDSKNAADFALIHQKLRETGIEWDNLGVETAGTSSSAQFYSLIVTDTFRAMNSNFKYNDAAKLFGADEAIAMAIAKFIQHETGHPKFDRDRSDDAPDAAQGGHVDNTIMQEAVVYGKTENYSIYQVAILQELHGRLNKKVKIPDTNWTSFLSSKYIINTVNDLQNKSWEDISKTIKDASYATILNAMRGIAYEDLLSIFSMRADLPKTK